MRKRDLGRIVTSAVKRPFLVVYDYGMGGVWAYVWAESEDQIRDKLDVKIVRELPDWIVDDESGVRSVDIDQPPDWMLAS